MNELDIIKTIKNTLSDSSLIGDDTAFIEELGIILTQDTLVENIHFRQSTICAYDLGIKSTAVNLSDIAASGAQAKYLLISLSLPKNIGKNFIQEFYDGVEFMCKKYNIKVAGGDITGAEKIVISICAIGISKGITPSKRSNAKIGDIIFTTGVHGSSFAGFLALENEKKVHQKLINAHINPVPQLETGRKIASSTKNICMMDSSDGLADAVFKIASSSNLSAEIDISSVPFEKEMKEFAIQSGQDYKNWILFGAEDYQLVGTLSQNNFERLKNEGLNLYKIGMMTSKKDHVVYIKDKQYSYTIDETDIKNKCFNHFEKGNH